MARARNIKPAFFKNEVLAEMPMEARMLFIGLWTLADREGRLEDRPKRIKMELFPYDSFDVDPMLSRLQEDGFLTRYDVGGVRFIQIENFVKHQDPHYKEKASEIPPPEGVEDIIKATAVTRGQRVRILERDGYRCQSCGAESHLCIDHVIPVSRGGDSSDDNLQVLCHSCNTKKGNKLDGEEKGQKKSIHRPGAVIARPNVGSNSNQQKCTSPSDSLSSDSLIPDSLIPDSEKSAGKPADLPGFAEFWKTWPSNDRKQAKGKCLDAWKKAHAERDAALILAHVESLKQTQSWRKNSGEFIPAPLVYLNNRRWEGADLAEAAEGSSVGHFV